MAISWNSEVSEHSNSGKSEGVTESGRAKAGRSSGVTESPTRILRSHRAAVRVGRAGSGVHRVSERRSRVVGRWPGPRRAKARQRGLKGARLAPFGGFRAVVVSSGGRVPMPAPWWQGSGPSGASTGPRLWHRRAVLGNRGGSPRRTGLPMLARPRCRAVSGLPMVSDLGSGADGPRHRSPHCTEQSFGMYRGHKRF